MNANIPFVCVSIKRTDFQLVDFYVCCYILNFFFFLSKGAVQLSSGQFDVVYNEKLWPGKLRNVQEENCISSIRDATIKKPIKKPDLNWNEIS